MNFKYENIVFTWINENISEEFSDEDVGFNKFNIPLEHILLMIEDDWCIEDTYGNNILPHSESEDCYIYNDSQQIEKYYDIYECYNADLLISYIAWMLFRKEQFSLEIQCEHPYWIFHDIIHAENDIHGVEVCCLSSHIEERRLSEGIDLMKEIFTEEQFDFYKFTEEYIEKCQNNFYERWKCYLPDGAFTSYKKEEIFEYYD